MATPPPAARRAGKARKYASLLTLSPKDDMEQLNILNIEELVSIYSVRE